MLEEIQSRIGIKGLHRVLQDGLSREQLQKVASDFHLSNGTTEDSAALAVNLANQACIEPQLSQQLVQLLKQSNRALLARMFESPDTILIQKYSPNQDSNGALPGQLLWALWNLRSRKCCHDLFESWLQSLNLQAPEQTPRKPVVEKEPETTDANETQESAGNPDQLSNAALEDQRSLIENSISVQEVEADFSAEDLVSPAEVDKVPADSRQTPEEFKSVEGASTTLDVIQRLETIEDRLQGLDNKLNAVIEAIEELKTFGIRSQPITEEAAEEVEDRDNEIAVTSTIEPGVDTEEPTEERIEDEGFPAPADSEYALETTEETENLIDRSLAPEENEKEFAGEASLALEEESSTEESEESQPEEKEETVVEASVSEQVSVDQTEPPAGQEEDETTVVAEATEEIVEEKIEETPGAQEETSDEEPHGTDIQQALLDEAASLYAEVNSYSQSPPVEQEETLSELEKSEPSEQTASVEPEESEPLEEEEPVVAEEVPTEVQEAAPAKETKEPQLPIFHKETIVIIGGRDELLNDYRLQIEQLGGRFEHYAAIDEFSNEWLEALADRSYLLVVLGDSITQPGTYRLMDVAARLGRRLYVHHSTAPNSLRRFLLTLFEGGRL